ncbi:MAG: hypothetical protein JNL30_03130 [Rubrivivax sp.]|nr:hypothetical protein [Rubrivivax sp.]
MEAPPPLHIVGCVIASRPAAELIDGLAAQLRRERAVVMVKSAQGATFVRFNAPDARLVTLAAKAVQRHGAALRFGFAAGQRDTATTGGDGGLNISTRSMVQASDLAAGAADGEVLVSPQMALTLIEAGLSLRSRQVHLTGGRSVAACLVGPPEVAPGSGALATAAAGLPGTPVAPQEPGPPAEAPSQSLVSVFEALGQQAFEVARRQQELEARQDALLGRMTLVEEGQPSTHHLAELEAALDAQRERIEARLADVEQLERRVGQLQRTSTDLERRLADQLRRRDEVESLKALCDDLLAQLGDLQPRLADVTALRAQLHPLTDQAQALTQVLQAAQQSASGCEQRLGRLEADATALQAQLAPLAQRTPQLAALRVEVDELHSRAARGRADVAYLAEHQERLSQLRTGVDELLGRAAGLDEKIAGIEARRTLVEEVHAQAGSLSHMLGDLQLHLERLSEQRAMVDHVGEKLARLEYTLQEGQATLRALQREREVAERIEQGLKALRARGAAQAG